MVNLRRLIKKPNRRSIVITFCVFIFLAALLYLLMGRLPSTIWVPASNTYQSENDILFNLPVKTRTVITLYGRALVFRTTDLAGADIFEFTSNPFLKASDCPNVTLTESLDPTECKVVGSFQGSNIYEIRRSDERSSSEQFIKLNNTFIYIISNGYGPDYIQHFVSMPRKQVANYLSMTNALATPITTRQQQQKTATDQKNAVAYTKLPFTPSLPKSLPAGWHLLTNITTPVIQIDGPDADHPMLVSMNYTNGKDQYVTLHEGLLSAFRLGSTCGPTPGDSMQDLPCTKVAGTSYYQATLYDTNNALIRYLYYPLGDSLIISETAAYVNRVPKTSMPPDLAAVQEEITLSTKPVDKAALKGSVYSKVFY